MIRQEDVYKIGIFTKPHGVRGEIAFSFTDDVFDRVDCDYLVCLLDGILVPFFIEDYRFKNDSVALVKFEDIDTAEQARRFTNVEVFFPLHLRDDVESDELSWEQLSGFEIEDVTFGKLGILKSVDDSTMNILFVIDHQEEELLVPAHEELIVEINSDKRLITLQLPDGLINIEEAAEA